MSVLAFSARTGGPAAGRRGSATKMRDLAFLAFIGYILLLGLKRPFLWVLLYVYIDILAP
ncbi:MAG: hypothetical protein OHK0018_11790 [Erythrobacter tepidarius]